MQVPGPRHEHAAYEQRARAPAADASEYGLTRAVNGDVLIVALDSVKEPATEEISLQSQMAERVARTTANADLNALIAQLKQKTEVTYSLDTAAQ